MTKLRINLENKSFVFYLLTSKPLISTHIIDSMSTLLSNEILTSL